MLANYETYKGSGKIIDIVFMESFYDSNYYSAQPQLVPIYGEKRVFQNVVNPVIPTGSLQVIINAFIKWEVVEYQDFYGRNEWDVYERAFWKAFERNVWDIYQGSFQKIYYPTFKRATASSSSTNTLVTLVTLGGGKFDNGHTYVQIDVAAAKAGSLRFEIADSSPNNRPIGYFYNVRIEGDKLIVFFDDNLISAKYGAYVVNDPSQFPGNAPSHPATGSSYAFDMPAGYGDTVYLYFHNEGGIKWYNGSGYYFAGWVLKGTQEFDPEPVGRGETGYDFVADKVIEYPIGREASEEYFIETREIQRYFLEKDFDGPYYFDVYKADGEEFVASQQFYGYSAVIEDLEVGEYFVRVKANGYNFWELPVTVEAGDPVPIDLGRVLAYTIDEPVDQLLGDKVEIFWLDPVFNEIEKDDEYFDIEVEPVTLPPKELDPIYLGNDTDAFGPDAVRLD